MAEKSLNSLIPLNYLFYKRGKKSFSITLIYCR